ncbi:MAG: hypothetical protein K1X57_17090, partial [Gemmataceae bacterium]|nr:hypothetical protein [Gemmataceae bacterium]
MRTRTRRLWLSTLEDRLAPSASVLGGYSPATGLTTPFAQLVAAPGFHDLAAVPAITPAISLTHMRAVGVDLPALQSILSKAPRETPGTAVQNSISVSLPTPDGRSAQFRVWEVSYTEPGYATLNPDMKTLVGRGIDDPAASLAVDIGGALGFHASVRSPNGSWYIDPYFHLNQSVYAVYDRGDIAPAAGGDMHCETDDLPIKSPEGPTTASFKSSGPADDQPAGLLSNGSEIRSFRLAVAATAEYTANFGGAAGAEAAIKSMVTRINQVYEPELAVRLLLVANNNSIIFTDTNTDGYTSGNSDKLIDENQLKVNGVIGTSNYDIGHVFDCSGPLTSFNGLAGLGVVGNAVSKARGVSISGTPASTFHPFVECVLHEMGHQFGASHTYNGMDSGLSERDSAYAYEPGGGTTIMSYGYNAASLPQNNLQGFTDDYFHIASLDQITNFLATIPGVGSKAASGNTPPVANAGGEYTIPARTPFVLSGSGTDADNDPLTFTWEQFDLGPAMNVGDPDNGKSPLFRSVLPTPGGNVRSFPNLATVLDGFSQNSSGPETAITTTRDMVFRLTARDNRPDRGAFHSSSTIIHAKDTGVGFGVTNFNGFGTEAFAGTKQTVTWEVAGTTGNGINTNLVNIDLSTDGGYTFTTISASEVNDGSAQVTLPANSATTKARFRIRAVGNVFYDISNVDFTIKAIPSFKVFNPFDSGPGTLRQAILDAIAYPGAQTITFDSSFFNVPRTITLTGGELAISEAVTINGPGSGFVTISGNNNSRIFNTDAAPSNAGITIRDVTLTSGLASDGGAIYIGNENVTIENSVINGCSATVDGGAINVENAGSLTLSYCTVSGNVANDDGGGVYVNNGGSVDLFKSTVVNNVAVVGEGGGLYFFGTANTSGAPGVRALACTIAGNSAAAGGGGVILKNFSGNFTVENSTITGNSTINGGGGGILRTGSFTGTMSLSSTIVSGNTGPSTAPDIGSNTAVNVNWSAIGSTVGFTLTGGNNLIGQNLKLRPLANNGGPAPTVAFEYDSPLRNKGVDNNFSLDQRGFPRNNNGVDIGAFELQTTVVNANNGGAGSLREAVAESNRVVGADTITFGGAFSTPQTIVLNSGEMVMSDAATVIGPGSGLLTISGNNASRIFNITAVPSGKSVVLRGMNLTAGYNVAGPSSSGLGGAVCADDEYLVVENCTLSKSFATHGGAIFVGPSGKLSLTQSTLSNNIAVGIGGAIWFVNGGNSEVIASSLVGNSAGVGGAIYLSGQGSTLTVLNSTVSGNSATNGGGLALDTFIGALTIRNTTVTANTASNRGGGLDSLNGTPNIHLESTIVSGNSAGTGPDISSTSTITVNRSAIGSAAGFTFTGTNNLPFGANLKLGPLAPNGGPTLTHLPAGDSPVVNAGSNPAGLTTDQRGITRTLLGGTDIGSVELTSVPDTTAPTIISITSTTPDGSYGAGASVSIDVNFSEAVTLNGTLIISLDSGGAAYVYGPFTGTKFSGTYTVAAGQGSSDLNVTSLSLPGGGTLRDAALNNASLVLPVGNNLANNKAIVVVNKSGGAGTVTNLLDSGPGSLRAAIAKANASPGANTILFDVNLTGTITLTSQLDITEAVTIIGPAAAPVTINGNNAVRIFNTFNAPANSVINFSRLTITNGKASFGAGLQMGDEIVLLDRCVLTDNSANVSGGAIWMSAGSLALQNSTVSNNKAPGSTGFGGGGIYASNGSVTVLNCTISGNSVTGSGNAGGGLFVRAVNGAGALIRNSTLTGNSAAAGGAIAGDYGFNGTIDIQNSTITGNSANAGGGIDQNGYFGKVLLASSIVFGNVAPTGPDLRSSVAITATASLIGSKAGAFNFTGDSFTNANVGVDPLLGPFNNYGGPTLTYGVLAGSPAINNGTNPFNETYDQRGIGFPRVVGGTADIGAVEGTVTAPSLVVSNVNDSGDGSLRQAIINANNLPRANTVTFDPAFFATPRTIVLTSAEIAITDALTIAGPGALLATVSGGNARRLFNTSPAPAGAAITVSGLTLTAGKASVGGALLAEDESISVTASVITGNSATNGGGIAVTYGGTLNLTQSTVSGNIASVLGGGIYLNYSSLGGSSAEIVASSVVNNNSGVNGGGLFVLGNAGAAGLRFTNSTVSGNSATGKGGGIALQRLGNNFQVYNSTVAGNTSGTGSFGGGGGGGICLFEGSGSITVDSSIISGNLTAEGGVDIQSPNVVNVNFSAIGSNAGFTLTGGNNLPVGALLQLRPLAFNGGPTQSVAFDAGSALRNAGRNALSLTTDQRGINRNNGGVDIGAFELNTLVTNANDAGVGSLRDAVAESNRVVGADTITFDSSFASAKTITLTSGQMVFADTTGATTITGPGSNLLTISGNNLSRAFLINSGVSGVLTGMTVANCTSSYGGALQNSGAVTVSSSRFTNNKSDYGGAIFNVGSVSVNNCTFDSNAANFGTGWGGALINGTTVGVAGITSCTFTNNYASQLGGAVIGYSFNIADSTFANNTSGLNGGALRTDGTVVITGSTFTGNTAANDGGAIMSHGSTTITNSTLA